MMCPMSSPPRRRLLASACLALTTLCLLAPARGADRTTKSDAPRAAAPAPPNVVFILLDDLGYRDFACYGSTFYETPNLDRLAAQGMRFTQAYAACPVCSPTRASLLTGQYPARVGVTDWIGGNARGKLVDAPYTHYLPLEQTTLAETLRHARYQTWHVGKWHLGGKDYWPTRHGFDANVGGFAAGHPASYFSPYKNPNLPDGPKGEYLTDRLTDETLRLIKDRDPARPFFLNLWHYAVHTPIQSPPALVAKYEKKARDMGLADVQALVAGEHFPTVNKADKFVARRRIQSDPAYAAMVENVDHNIGRLLNALDDAGLADNTLVIVTSDNGGVSTAEGSPTSNAPLRDGKGWLYEGGIREPLLVRWPGHVRPNSTCDTPVTSPDFYPTLLHAAGLPPLPQQHADGVDLTPVLEHTGPIARDALFWHYPHYGNQGGTPASAIRSGDWKLIEFFEDNHVELYNLQDDPGESHDLAKSQPDRAREMQGKLAAWRQSVNAKLPTPNPDYGKPVKSAPQKPSEE